MRHVAAISILALATTAGLAHAQAAQAAAPVRSTGNLQRDTLARTLRPVSIDFKETRLEDVMRFITEVTQADIEVMWQDDRNATGLDKDTPITLSFSRGTALDLIDKVMEKAADSEGFGGGNTWQVSESGTLQIGPKSRLNRWRRLEIYSIADLLTEVPDYNQAPEFDLQAVLQNTGQQGGGSSQSPFRDNQGANAANRRDIDDKVNELINIITSLVETEQWVDNGGEAATIRYFQSNLLINAPDYVHRQINGYPWWPSQSTRSASVKGRRYVTLGVDTSIAKVLGISQVPVTAVTGDGTLIRSNPGPGDSATPAQPATQPPK
jgi:hypothetical protein